MATFVYRHIHTNQMVYVPTLEFAGNPDWELISGGGGGGDATVVQADLNIHKGSSTSVHGIDNTADLETKLGAQDKANAAANASIPLIQKGAASGVATLDGSSKLTSAQLPAISASTITTGTLPIGQMPPLPGTAITSGTVAYARLPVGTTPSTVAAADDIRITGAASTTALTDGLALKVGKGDEVLNVKDFGAHGIGDGHDDTPHIQAAIDAAIGGTPAGAASNGNRQAIKPVYIPKGTYNITAPLKIYGVIGFKMYGDGFNTALYVSGTNLPYLIDCNGIRHALFENFRIQGITDADTVVTAFGLNNIPAVSVNASCYSVTLRKISISALTYVNGFGFGESSGSLDISSISVYDCLAAGKSLSGGPPWTPQDPTYWQAGFVSGSGTHGNPLDHYYYGCKAIANKYGYYANACNMTIVGAEAGLNEVDFYQNGNRFMHVTGVRSETSQRMFGQSGTGGGIGSYVSFNDVIFQTNGLNADNRLMQVQYGGTVNLNNVTFGFANAPAPVIYLNSVSPSSITISGLTTRTALGSLFEVNGATQSSVVINNYSQCSSGGGVIDRVPFWAKNFGTFTASQKPTLTDGLRVGSATDVLTGTGAPEGAVTAPVGSLFLRANGAAGTTAYTKETGSGNTGWAALSTSGVPNVQEFTGSGTWTKPASATATSRVEVVLIPGGCGGGSGRRGAAASICCGGGGGGSGHLMRRAFVAGDLASTVAVTVGVGGAGGAAVTTNDTSGSVGTNGTATTFGTLCVGNAASAGAGGTATGGAGGAGPFGISATNMGLGGSASASGGAGGGANPGTFGPGSGGAGGGITSGDVANNGGFGGATHVGSSAGTGGAGGVVDSTAPGTGTAATLKGSPGPGAGGGAASTTIAAQAGANAPNFGGGGGGGGGSRNGNNSGAGGNGGPGYALVITY